MSKVHNLFLGEYYKDLAESAMDKHCVHCPSDYCLDCFYHSYFLHNKNKQWEQEIMLDKYLGNFGE